MIADEGERYWTGDDVVEGDSEKLARRLSDVGAICRGYIVGLSGGVDDPVYHIRVYPGMTDADVGALICENSPGFGHSIYQVPDALWSFYLQWFERVIGELRSDCELIPPWDEDEAPFLHEWILREYDRDNECLSLRICTSADAYAGEGRLI